MKIQTTQYVLSLNTLYRLYPKYLPKNDYEDINNLIEHYSAKKTLTNLEAKEAEMKCKGHWKVFFSSLFTQLKKKMKKYADILKEEEKEILKLKNKVDLNHLPLGEYEKIWDDWDSLYRKITSKINAEKRNSRRNWKGYFVSFVSGIVATIITTWLWTRFFGG